MSLLTQIGAGSTGKLVRQIVAAFAALTMVGANVEAACQCLTQATANHGDHDRDCCCPMDSSSAVKVQASTCGSACMTAQGKAPVAETLAVPDNPPSVLVVPVATAIHGFASTTAPTLIVEAPPLIFPSPHPILRI